MANAVSDAKKEWATKNVHKLYAGQTWLNEKGEVAGTFGKTKDTEGNVVYAPPDTLKTRESHGGDTFYSQFLDKYDASQTPGTGQHFTDTNQYVDTHTTNIGGEDVLSHPGVVTEKKEEEEEDIEIKTQDVNTDPNLTAADIRGMMNNWQAPTIQVAAPDFSGIEAGIRESNQQFQDFLKQQSAAEAARQAKAMQITRTTAKSVGGGTAQSPMSIRGASLSPIGTGGFAGPGGLSRTTTTLPKTFQNKTLNI